ncbi:MAG: integron integrase [Caballeronia mineralivorans]|jgi:hypothetical protein|nr:phage integrase N-terminal SAM-like domain-containing protein [Caballeronia mineralivorans]MDB5781777.1 integron integrase [Caballeronia mineralivorans]
MFLSYLVNERNVAGATYTQTLCAILFLYKKTLKIDVPWIEGIQRPKKPAKRKRSAAGVRTPSTKVMQIGPQRVGGEHLLPDARRELTIHQFLPSVKKYILA